MGPLIRSGNCDRLGIMLSKFMGDGHCAEIIFPFGRNSYFHDDEGIMSYLM